jgi:protein-tyrosine phosphatase
MTVSSNPKPPLAVLFVCSGNICRSPTAEGVFRHLLAKAGLEGCVRVDSAGLHGLHQGEPPDQRSQAAARLRGFEIGDLRARTVQASDFGEFDFIAVMDQGHLLDLSRLCPPDLRERISLLMDFAPKAGCREVPDPYYGGPPGFEQVLALCEAGTQGLLDHVRKSLDRR